MDLLVLLEVLLLEVLLEVLLPLLLLEVLLLLRRNQDHLMREIAPPMHLCLLVVRLVCAEVVGGAPSLPALLAPPSLVRGLRMIYDTGPSFPLRRRVSDCVCALIPLYLRATKRIGRRVSVKKHTGAERDEHRSTGLDFARTRCH